MLQHIISSRVEKSKQNVEAYRFSSGSQQQSQPPPPQQLNSTSSGSRPTSQVHPQLTPNTNLNKPKLNKNEFDVKFMNVAGK